MPSRAANPGRKENAMTLDRELAKEIKKAQGDGSREARFSLWRTVQDAQDLMSDESFNGPSRVNESLGCYGRVATALVIASTLYTRSERIDGWGLSWANAVLSLWTNRGPSFVERASIDDWFYHPTRICEYAASFIRITTEEE